MDVETKQGDLILTEAYLKLNKNHWHAASTAMQRWYVA